MFGEAHIYASFVHRMDLYGKGIISRVTGGLKTNFNHDEALSYAATLAPQDITKKCKPLGITALHIMLRATGGNFTKTPGPRTQSVLRALARLPMNVDRIEDLTQISSDPERLSPRSSYVRPVFFFSQRVCFPHSLRRRASGWTPSATNSTTA